MFDASVVRLSSAGFGLCLVLSLSACDRFSGSGFATTSSASSAVVATVDGLAITDREIAPMRAAGLDRANAIDRAINRAVAAGLAKKQFPAEISEAIRAAELEIGANVYVTHQMADLLKQVKAEDIAARYASDIKAADFNGYQLAFAIYPTEGEARAGRAAALARAPDALKAFKPVSPDAEGNPLFIGRNAVPYNLGVFVAKLKEGEFTEPVLVRNGYIVLQARQIKVNPKPALDLVQESLRRTIADERLAVLLQTARKAAVVSLK